MRLSSRGHALNYQQVHYFLVVFLNVILREDLSGVILLNIDSISLFLLLRHGEILQSAQLSVLFVWSVLVTLNRASDGLNIASNLSLGKLPVRVFLVSILIEDLSVYFHLILESESLKVLR